MNGLSLGKVMVTQVMPSAVQAKRGPKKKPPKELPCPKCKKVFAKEILLQVSSSFCMYESLYVYHSQKCNSVQMSFYVWNKCSVLYGFRLKPYLHWFRTTIIMFIHLRHYVMYAVNNY